MASYRLLIIIGTLLAVSILAFSDPIPSSHESRYLKCKSKALEAIRNFKICLERGFNSEAVNETIRMFGNSNCNVCTHLCRKDEMSKCVGNMTEEMATLSNKAAVMMPFLRNIFNETYSAVCENDAEILRVIVTPESQLRMRDLVETCARQLEEFIDIDNRFICDHTDPANDNLTTELYCQKILRILECFKGSSGNYPDFHRAVINLENKLINSDSCSKYF